MFALVYSPSLPRASEKSTNLYIQKQKKPGNYDLGDYVNVQSEFTSHVSLLSRQCFVTLSVAEGLTAC